jgi:glycosyltransferase involved in cell wall biosynthesis
MSKKLAIVITHPIQYYVPIFRSLAKKCNLKVFYTWGESAIEKKFDPGFGKEIQWDLPLLDGYHFEFLKNTAKQPGSHHGKGIINPGLIKKIKEFKPNAILIYGYMYNSHFKVMRYFKGKTPIWFRGDSTLLNEGKNLKSIAKWLYLNLVYRFIDKAFYVGVNNRAYFKKFGVDDENLIFAPHAVDNNRFAENKEKEAKELRISLGLSSNDILLLYAGKFDRVKNTELLLDAFIELTNDEKKHLMSDEVLHSRKVHLLFVGNGALEQKLKQKSKEFNEKKEQKLIHFIDFQNQMQMPIVYQACDLFCLPSKSETWGLAINEAMAAGKAVIASDKVGCAVDLVTNGKNGFIFKSDDLNHLILTLENSLSADLNQMGENSKLQIRDWSFENQVSNFISNLNGNIEK